jgi:hypothetical protein
MRKNPPSRAAMVRHLLKRRTDMRRHWLAAAVAAVAVLAAPTAQGRPPPPGSSLAEDMAPYGDMIRSLQNGGGRACCDESDCRPVRAELRNDGHWWVFVSSTVFENGTNVWQQVPDWAIVPPERRPMLPWPLACWIWLPNITFGAFQCFTPPTGT